MEEEKRNSKIHIVKYEKTSCYYCSEWLDTQTFGEHIIHCGQVLEKCPNSCNSYIQRKKLRCHLIDCPKEAKKPDDDEDISLLELGDLREYENRMMVLEQDVSALRSVLNEEIKQRLHLITDVGSLRKHNQITDEWTQKVGDVLSALKKCVNEETLARTTELKRSREDIHHLIKQHNELQNWKSAAINHLSKLQNSFVKDETLRENFILAIEDQDILLQDFHKLKLEFNEIKFQLSEVAEQTKINTKSFTDKFNKIEEILENQLNKRQSLQFGGNDLQKSIDEIRNDLQVKFVSNTDLNTKQMMLDYEVKSMKNIVQETEEKCELLERNIMESNRTMYETRQGLEDLQINLLYQKKLNGIQNSRGHMIWKISEYSKKMQEAISYDTCLHGPMFLNKQFGYTLRLEVHLNGIGTWKGRNMIVSLTVVQGEYDPLLQWPCNLQADVILRDQPENISDAIDYLRATLVKKKNEDYHTNQYIHIPHKIIESRNYIRNDALFLEVKILKNGYLGIGSHLSRSSKNLH